MDELFRRRIGQVSSATKLIRLAQTYSEEQGREQALMNATFEGRLAALESRVEQHEAQHRSHSVCATSPLTRDQAYDDKTSQKATTTIHADRTLNIDLEARADAARAGEVAEQAFKGGHGHAERCKKVGERAIGPVRALMIVQCWFRSASRGATYEFVQPFSDRFQS